MNLRITTYLFAFLLLILWSFGLMVALRNSALDLGYVLPRLAEQSKAKISSADSKGIVSAEIVKDDSKRLDFTKSDDGHWYVTVPPSKQKVRVLDNKVDGLIDEVRNARHSNDEVPELTNNPAEWGLTSPKMTVTLKTADGGESQLFIGKESGDHHFVFVNSSERKRDVLAVNRSSIASVFSDVDDYRSRTLLDALEVAVNRIDIKENRDGKTAELDLQKIKGKNWRFNQPPLGAADFEATATGKADDSVSGLIRQVTALRVEKFEAIGSTMTLDPAKALLRIEIVTETDEKDKKEKDKAAPTKQVLLIGDKVRDEEMYYARLEGGNVDTSVVRVNSKSVEPILALVKDPKPLRSHDIAQVDPQSIDAVEIFHGKEFAKLFKNDDTWRVFPNDAPFKQASSTSVTGPSGLLSAIQGQHEIKDKDFVDADTPEKKKELEAKFAPDKLNAKVTVWSESLQPEPKKDLKKDDKVQEKKVEEKKAEVKETPKEDKKDGKDSKDSKDAKDAKGAAGAQKTDAPKDAKDAKTDASAQKKEAPKDTKEPKVTTKPDQQPLPKFKDNAKPVVTLSFVNVDRENVLVKREAPDVEPAYFNLAVADYDKIVPYDMALAFFDTTVKTFSPTEVNKLELDRAPLKDRDKLQETFLLERVSKEKAKEPEKAKDADKNKDKPADAAKNVDKAKDQAKPADKAADKKDEAEPKTDWTLVEPKEFAGKGEVDVGEVEKVLFALTDLHAVRWVVKADKETLGHYGLDDKSWSTRASATLKKDALSKEEPKPFVIRLGETSKKASDKDAVYAYVEGTDYIFLVDNKLDKTLKEAEFRDRHVLKFDPNKVKELRVFVTTADKEVRKPVFERAADKSWEEKKGTLGFKLDSRKVDDLVDTLSKLQVVRYLNSKGALPKDYELGVAAPLKLEVVMDDGKTVYTVTVGTQAEKNGPYYAQSSSLPGGAFLLSKDPFGDLMGRVTYFRKD